MLLAVNVVVAMLAGAPPAPPAPPQFGFSVAAMGDNMVLQQAPAAVSDRLIRIFISYIYLRCFFFKVASVRALLAPCFLRHLIRGTGCRKLACADVPNSVALAVFSSFSFVSLSFLYFCTGCCLRQSGYRWHVGFRHRDRNSHA